ncbi:cupredoxin domain-containing protein [Cohnella silvisoli]|uniref:Cupredoxin domain-containing protein n=1 Tax=Cohnella silvisoli TaxID=2873699 RepID=A0ABV1L598_9BACL|nr:cupredoxin domain-containing protein [Cohnella silvisoli]MCD9026508.1 cupredoxin domain-containing protein [Cohnella silvisoli]
MLLNIGSLIMIVLATGYSLFILHRRKDLMSTRAGKFDATLLAVIAGLAMGIVAVQTLEYNQPQAMGVAVPLAAVLGYFAGKRFSHLFSIHSALTGCLSAYAGIVFGMRFFASDNVVFATDVVFIVFLFLFLRSVEWQSNVEHNKKTQVKRKKKHSDKSGYATVVMYGIGTAALATVIWLWGNSVPIGQIGQPQSQQSEYDEENDLQVAVIEVNAAGFSPLNTNFNKGGMIKAVFHVSSYAKANLTLVSADLNVNAQLKQGDNVFLFNNPQPGTYKFIVGEETSLCTFTVK